MIRNAELPSSWRLLPIRRVLARLARPVRETDEVVTAYRDGLVDLRSRRREEGYTFADKEQGYQGVEPGDVVFHALDGFAGAVGVSKARGKCSPVYHVCSALDGHDPRFVVYGLRAMSALGYLEANAFSVRQRAVDYRNWDVFARLELPCPPPHVQRWIADYLDSEIARIDHLVQLKRQMLERADERRVATIDHSILTEGGVERPLTALADYVNGWPFKPDDFTVEGLPVIRIKQLVDRDAECDYYDGVLPERVRLRDGDTIFSWSGSLEVRRWDRGDAYLNQHLFRVVPVSGVSADWLEYALDCATRLLDRLIHGSAMTHITKPMMKDVRLPVPSVERQQVVAAKLRRASEWSVRLSIGLRRQLDLLGEHRRTLMTSAVAGELDVVRVA